MKNNMQRNEKKLISKISFVASMRTLGTSLIIPFIAIYAKELPDSTAYLSGIAFGVFGISQAVLQLPMGRLSDKWGRKETILLALSIYFIGTLLCGLSTNIYHLIFARFLSGVGAFTGVSMAWLTDGTDSERRNSALSYVGLSIGSAVIIGFPLSPILAYEYGIPTLFYISSALIFISIIFIILFMNNQDTEDRCDILIKKESLYAILRDYNIVKLNIIAFLSNLANSSIWFTMPLLIKEKMTITEMWKLYLPISVIGTSLMFYFNQKADKSGTIRTSLIAITFTLAGIIIPIVFINLISYIISFILLYSGNRILSPVITAAVSRYPNNCHKGSLMGILNSFQFMGFFIGGLLGGFMYKFGHQYLFSILFVLFLFCLYSIFTLTDSFEG
ncbi:MAG: MFS transporter [Spirochaetota bacterium]|nr:MFS transporter [Spirochaetota bacterium]